jgi:hypothetical protein
MLTGYVNDWNASPKGCEVNVQEVYHRVNRSQSPKQVLGESLVSMQQQQQQQQ